MRHLVRFEIGTGNQESDYSINKTAINSSGRGYDRASNEYTGEEIAHASVIDEIGVFYRETVIKRCSVIKNVPLRTNHDVGLRELGIDTSNFITEKGEFFLSHFNHSLTEEEIADGVIELSDTGGGFSLIYDPEYFGLTDDYEPIPANDE